MNPRIILLAAIAVSSIGFSLTSPASAHSDGCSRRGDVAGINCQLARWVHCEAGAVRATQFDASGPTACRLHGNVVALPHAASRGLCGAQITVTNARTGASTTATVGDSGPATIAAIDLSHTTARIIGFGGGSGCVHIGGTIVAQGDASPRRQGRRAKHRQPVVEVSARDMTAH